ncbi:MAG: hypothetical protein WC450_07940 [Candidatus Omnitrophota bacterium]|jgi:radical SAM superfamily enzyme YgiQ (UPF0313 family)
MKIVFLYKGRYFLQDAVVTETLSAIAKRHGHETVLVYDQDSFGLSDNIISSPRLHRLFSRSKNLAKKILKVKPDLIIFYDAIHLHENWMRALRKEIKSLANSVKTVYLSYIDIPAPGDYDFILIGEPELTFDMFLRERHYAGPQTIFRNPGVADLNALPLPDKCLFERYVNFKDSYMVFTSKGCPGHCSYCLETILKDRMGTHYCRRRFPEHVIAELKEAKQIGRAHV